MKTYRTEIKTCDQKEKQHTVAESCSQTTQHNERKERKKFVLNHKVDSSNVINE